ncbi:alcohol dehydrogenase [Trichoderma arundinaceum]|uniref:Alcohol dehydrogenase n=1 Tax=Trichoderma arundinaceum TaxID=490622 RepID=A0A395NXG2_TRIAR|nr:alcohol dehydrogenase [Trichoderma arundinaceum]
MLLTNTQTAAWLDHPHHGAILTLRNDIPIPEPLEGEVLVKLECTGFCHSDVHSIYGETPMETNIAGHEGVGRVVETGVTVYAGVAQASKFIKQGDSVVILGAGGGLGHLAVQVATVSGYRVIAVDSGDKADICKISGAAEFINFQKQDVEKAVKEITGGIGAHAVMVTAGSERAYESVPGLLRNLGVLVCIGIPRLDFHVPISPFEIIVRGLKIVGTSVGTESDIQELLKLTAEGKVKPQIEVYDFGDINAVMDKLAKFQVKGRAVLRLPQ